MERSSKTAWIVGGVAVVVAACLCVGALLTGGAALFLMRSSGQPATGVEITLSPSELATPAAPAGEVTQPAAPLKPIERQAEQAAAETLATIAEQDVPENDLYDLASRLEGKQDVARTLPSPATALQVGDQQQFWVSNTDDNSNFQITATLQYVTPHLYFWIEDGVRFNARELKDLCEAFENKIYPTNREFFGSEWTPGVDDDPHLYVLLAGNLGERLAGYFSSADEYNPQVHPYSNGHEMFLLNADNIDLGDSFTYGVLAHEFQHMIHWYRDRNEESWINEGFSELAAFLNGYDGGGFANVFLRDTDLQLNDWPNDSSATTPHYGAGFLFLNYFLSRFGEQATQALVADPLNGLVSVDDVLAREKATDPRTGAPLTADDIFADWAVTNYLQDGRVGDGRYAYTRDPGVISARPTETFANCPLRPQSREVSQYGTDYIRITCAGEYTLHFAGAPLVGVLPEDPHSGAYAFWSNKGDESDMTLTRTFDFSGASGPLEMSYWTWYDVEKDYDYVYLEASLDGGATWQILQTPSGNDSNPSGNSYGWGYNGETLNWIKETVDLSAYAGKEVQLRFEYVTDAAVNGEGFLLDDISIPQIGYASDFEADDGGWEAQGFVRIQNALPQTFRVSLILQGKNKTTVQPVTLDADLTASVPFELGGDYNQAVLVVSGTTRFTRQPAEYRLTITP